MLKKDAIISELNRILSLPDAELRHGISEFVAVLNRVKEHPIPRWRESEEGAIVAAKNFIADTTMSPMDRHSQSIEIIHQLKSMEKEVSELKTTIVKDVLGVS